MKILVVGGGGREHALAWKAVQSAGVEKVFVAPGNAGTAVEAGVENVAIEADDIPALVEFAACENVALTIIGPEVPLVAGIVDAFELAGLRCFGPRKNAAILEGSKTFTKDFMARHHIPSAFYGSFTEVDEAIAYIKQHGAPIVVKADGLAAGKGVVIAQTEDEAIAAVQDMLQGNSFGEAGHRVVVEEFLLGEEASFIVICDGVNTLPMATSQDHKARNNGDSGPNTGGMGAYTPAPVVTDEMHERIMREVIEPTVRGMREDGRSYTGFLYAGVMVTPDGTPKVLEYNCRFGDPETQPIMMRLQSDLVALCNAALDGRLDAAESHWDQRPALGVVMAAGNYPAGSSKGDEISGLQGVDTETIKVFHAGTSLDDGRVVTNGGRVLCVVGMGDNVQEAYNRAYQGVAKITWRDAYYRTDIGHRAIAREKNQGSI